MLAILLGKAVQLAGRGLTRHTQVRFYACWGVNSAPGGILLPGPAGVGVNLLIVQQMSKIAA